MKSILRVLLYIFIVLFIVSCAVIPHMYIRGYLGGRVEFEKDIHSVNVETGEVRYNLTVWNWHNGNIVRHHTYGDLSMQDIDTLKVSEKRISKLIFK